MSDRLNNRGVSDPPTTEHDDHFCSIIQEAEADKVENGPLTGSRLVRIAVGASGWSAVTFMVSSKMGGGSNPLTLPGNRSLPPTRHGISKRTMCRPTRRPFRGSDMTR